MRVLIVDDDQAHGESLSDLLNSKGHEAHFARDLPEARWLVDLLRFRLALLDHDMVPMTGPQIARELIALDPRLQAVVMSAREENERHAREMGALPFLAKPIRVPELFHLIERVEIRILGNPVARRLEFPVLPLSSLAPPADDPSADDPSADDPPADDPPADDPHPSGGPT